MMVLLHGKYLGDHLKNLRQLKITKKSQSTIKINNNSVIL